MASNSTFDNDNPPDQSQIVTMKSLPQTNVAMDHGQGIDKALLYTIFGLLGVGIVGFIWHRWSDRKVDENLPGQEEENIEMVVE